MSSSSENFFDDTKRGRGEVKHAILRYYLGGYFGVMGQTPYFDQLIYVDGFSGPGKYESDDGTVEDGSPIVAIKTAINHIHCNNFNKPILMYFIEVDENYANQLEKNIDDVMKANPNYRNILKYEIYIGEFEEKMGLILDKFDKPGSAMLVFADPFGIKSIPMDLMRRIVNRRSTELFCNVMFSSAIRWINTKAYTKVLNKCVGEENSEWKKSVLIGENKTESFIRYYVEKLTESEEEGKFYRHIFGMKDQRNRHIYQLVFVTQHLKGLEIMKRAMIKNSQESEKFVYSEFVENHPERGLINKMSKAEIREVLTKEIKERFAKKMVRGRHIASFVWQDTVFIFNLKNELKKDFQKFIVDKSIKEFDEIVFSFPESKI